MPFQIDIGPCCSRFIDWFIFGEIQNKLIAENLLANVILLVYCTALHMRPIPPKLRNKCPVYPDCSSSPLHFRVHIHVYQKLEHCQNLFVISVLHRYRDIIPIKLIIVDDMEVIYFACEEFPKNSYHFNRPRNHCPHCFPCIFVCFSLSETMIDE